MKKIITTLITSVFVIGYFCQIAHAATFEQRYGANSRITNLPLYYKDYDHQRVAYYHRNNNNNDKKEEMNQKTKQKMKKKSRRIKKQIPEQKKIDRKY